MKTINKLNKCNNSDRVLTIQHPEIQSISVKDFQRKSLIQEDDLLRNLGFLRL